jgi:hypothetical protein
MVILDNSDTICYDSISVSLIYTLKELVKVTIEKYSYIVHK